MKNTYLQPITATIMLQATSIMQPVSIIIGGKEASSFKPEDGKLEVF